MLVRGSSLQVLSSSSLKPLHTLLELNPINFGIIPSQLKVYFHFATCCKGEFCYFKSQMSLCQQNQCHLGNNQSFNTQKSNNKDVWNEIEFNI